MATSDRGLGSANMSDADKSKIHRMGGQASGASRTTSSRKSDATINNSGGRIDKAAQRKGGQSSHKG